MTVCAGRADYSRLTWLDQVGECGEDSRDSADHDDTCSQYQHSAEGYELSGRDDHVPPSV